eukprot:m.41314 g.41314  ORF g.41314 m.41314 type:complete len:312 (+) comp9754_c0_seq1:805-1740(+)
MPLISPTMELRERWGFSLLQVVCLLPCLVSVWTSCMFEDMNPYVGLVFGSMVGLEHWGWTGALRVAALNAFITFLLVTFFLKNDKTQKPVDNTDADQQVEKKPKLEWSFLWKKVSKSKKFLLGVLFTVTITPLSEFQSLLPLFLKEVARFSAGAAGMLSSSFPAGAAVALMTIGTYYDGMDARMRLYSMACIYAVGLIALVILSLGDMASQHALCILLAFLFGASVSVPYYFPVPVFCVEFIGSEFAGTILAAVDAPGYAASMLFFEAVPYMKSEGGWNNVFVWMLRLYAISFVLLVVFLYSIWKSSKPSN